VISARHFPTPHSGGRLALNSGIEDRPFSFRNGPANFRYAEGHPVFPTIAKFQVTSHHFGHGAAIAIHGLRKEVHLAADLQPALQIAAGLFANREAWAISAHQLTGPGRTR